MLFSQKGIAFITSLILSLICIVLIALIFKLTLTSTKLSGKIKRYSTALEAAKGGIEDFIWSIKSTEFNVNPSDSRWIQDHNCKIDRETRNWPQVCSSICISDNCTSNAKSEDIINYCDWKNTYGNYTVYCKIVDIKAVIDTYFYTIEIVSKNNNTDEIAWFSVIYKK